MSLLEAIYNSKIPAPLSVVCAVIKFHIETSGAEAASDPNLRSLAAGFFLHFLCPIFVDPAAAGININLPKNTRRGMILCAKLLQTLANGNRFDVGYMQAMNPFLDRNEARFSQFCAEVVESGNDLAPYVFKSLPPSVEFELWWNLYCFIVRNREKIYEITSRKEPKATEELQKQLLVSNQYLLELYREYSQFWKQKSTPENDR
eukprot:CAMPEP_0206183822 /NCGR_PEP_ID=MMETSP0166-20121206/863_1 /ASSEMBLY_ACC=CAM_ASM_000260 /TAXON_ID=95228 /ORGANISM="Vannella robusta, Strain DIVA3 518/3/11/1/6" /LENGTH=203 /DNA_ID=CAMNT_0053598743 /DNA_START=304 /DNA_END=911 /DNA_ORIENTATION=-